MKDLELLAIQMKLPNATTVICKTFLVR